MNPFVQEIIVKIVGACALAFFTYVFGKRVIVKHKTGMWNFGKTLVVLSWFFQWGTLLILPLLYNGRIPQQDISLMWLGCFLFGRYMLRPVGRLLIV
jgi:hypothetical protein